MFFSEKFKPIGVPTHPLDPSDIDAQTKGARTSIVRLHLWQQVPVTSPSHKTHHPEQIFEHVHPETLEIMIQFDELLKWVGSTTN